MDKSWTNFIILSFSHPFVAELLCDELRQQNLSAFERAIKLLANLYRVAQQFHKLLLQSVSEPLNLSLIAS